MGYLLHMAVIIGLYIILACSLNLMAGCGGMVSLAHAALWGVGAYTAALLGAGLSSDLLLVAAVSGLVGWLLGGLLGLLAARMRDDSFVVVSLAIQLIFVGLFMNCTGITGGILGIAGIAQPGIFGLTISGRPGFLAVVAVMVLGCLVVSRRIIRSPYGRALVMMRDDSTFLEAAGKRSVSIRHSVSGLSGALAAVSGCVYAQYMSYIDPGHFGMMTSLQVLTMVIIGGSGSVSGPFVGALILAAIPELTGLFGASGAIAAHLGQVFTGLVLVAAILWRPQGIAGSGAFGWQAGNR